MHVVIGEVGDVGGARQKPQQLVNDALQKHLFAGNQGEPGGKIETHLMAKNAVGTGARAVGFEGTVVANVAHQVQILLHVHCLHCADHDVTSHVLAER
jgi:hypothetical protein